MVTPLRKSIARNRMTDTEQPAQILFPTNEIGGYVCVANTLRDDTLNWMDPTVNQPPSNSIKQPDQDTVTGTTYPLGFLIVVLMFPDTGRIFITALG